MVLLYCKSKYKAIRQIPDGRFNILKDEKIGELPSETPARKHKIQDPTNKATLQVIDVSFNLQSESLLFNR